MSCPAAAVHGGLQFPPSERCPAEQAQVLKRSAFDPQEEADREREEERQRLRR
jgi:hypothetical protein